MKYLITICIVSLLLGCASYQTTASKLLVSTAMTVDAGMKGWVSYMNTHGVTVEQDERARTAYRQYQVVMKAAQDSYFVLVKLNDRSDWVESTKQLAVATSYLLKALNTNNLTGEIRVP